MSETLGAPASLIDGPGWTPSKVDEIVADAPLVHAGGTCTWRLADEVLSFIDRSLDPGSRTLETGAGLSTLLFAAKRCHHTCVVPLEEEVQRLREHCSSRGIPLDRLHFEIGRSELVLPRLAAEALDLVLIDGNHAFPAPFIDWFYTTHRLKVGGVVIVDDTNLWTGDLLRRFLESEASEWRLLDTFGGRAAAFRKIAAGSDTKGWEEQPLVVSRSRWLTLRLELRRGWRLLRGGHFASFARKAVERCAALTRGPSRF